GEPLIADLGLAKHAQGDARRSVVTLSRTGDLRGTAGYAPPEQVSDAKSVGPPADVFALGAVLYEMLAGEPPFAAPSVVELLAQVEEGEHVPLAERCPRVPAWLALIVERCLETASERRFADGAALAAALTARG